MASGAVVFVVLARYVRAGQVYELDRRLILALRNAADPSDPLGPPWFEVLVRDFTAMGGFGMILLLTLASAGGLALQGRVRTALMAVAAIVAGVALSVTFKELFQRARPDLVDHGVHTSSSSFPSGHSMLSAVTYLTLGAVLASTQPTRILKIYVFAVAVILTLLVGFSRVYLGVHWPSDVLAGWAAGFAWAMVAWLITRRLQRERTIEPEPEQED